MDDIVGEIMFALSDVDILSADFVGVIGLFLGLCADEAEVGSGLRFGEVHGACPFAGDEFGEVFVFLLGRAVGVDGFDGALVEEGAEAEAHIGGLPHFLNGEGERPWEVLASVIFGERDGVPATLGVFSIGVFEAGGGGDFSVFQLCAVIVAGFV